MSKDKEWRHPIFNLTREEFNKAVDRINENHKEYLKKNPRKITKSSDLTSSFFFGNENGED